MKILGIDTSCDDTAISVMEIRNSKHEIRSNIVSSQVKLHAKYGGVYPMLAKREHQRNLSIVFKKAVKEASSLISGGRTSRKINREVRPPEIDFIAVTVGPGLEPCLWQGINFAKDLAQKLNKPLIPVNHIEAHILANFIVRSPTPHNLPAVCLVVSGGHTQLILMKDIGKYKLIGETRDDAAGECFDKTARILGLGYPGGPAIAARAAKLGGRRVSAQLPRPMMGQKNYDFSFSGLKTAVLYQNQKSKIKNQNYIRAMCREIQQSIIDVLIYKTIKSARDFGAKSIILGGGVAANDELRKQFVYKLKIKNYKLKFFVPPEILCTDNAAMVALTAYFHRSKIVENIEADSNLRI